MLDSLKQFKDRDYDSILFMPTEELNQVHFQVSNYIEPGTKLGGSTIGDCYHIILFKENDEGLVVKLDMFEAILMAPLEYISQLLPDEWFGVICKKTTTSEKYVLETFDNLKEVC